MVAVRGQLKTSTYEVNGEKKYSTEVVVERLAFLSNMPKQDEEEEEE